VRKRQAGTDGHLGTDNAVAAVKALFKHVHRTAAAVRDTALAAQQLANHLAHLAAAHVREAVAAVRRDDIVVARDGVLNADSNRLLARGQMAETANFLLLVQAVRSHLHLAHDDHVVVHLLQLLLGDLERIGRGVELVRLEALVAQVDGKHLVVGLRDSALVDVRRRRVSRDCPPGRGHGRRLGESRGHGGGSTQRHRRS
jgi:hypothetical protein